MSCSVQLLIPIPIKAIMFRNEDLQFRENMQKEPTFGFGKS